jgi:hypothetical protein
VADSGEARPQEDADAGYPLEVKDLEHWEKQANRLRRSFCGQEA